MYTQYKIYTYIYILIKTYCIALILTVTLQRCNYKMSFHFLGLTDLGLFS